MRAKWIYGIGVPPVLLIVLTLGSTSWAKTMVSQAAKNGETAQVVMELKSAQRLLVAADHDYEGHRAKAAEEVHNAIKELAGNHHNKKAQPGSATKAALAKNSSAKQPAVHESQASSDAQLRQAEMILQGIQGRMNTHHAKAAANVSAAISEISTALAIK